MSMEPTTAAAPPSAPAGPAAAAGSVSPHAVSPRSWLDEAPRLKVFDTQRQGSATGRIRMVVMHSSNGEEVTSWGTKLKQHRIDPILVNNLTSILYSSTVEDRIVLVGCGSYFCNGVDVRWPNSVPEKVDVIQTGFHELLKATLEKPVIGLINGHAYGGGWMLAMACSKRIFFWNDEKPAHFLVPASKQGYIYSPAQLDLLSERMRKMPKTVQMNLLVGDNDFAATKSFCEELQQWSVADQIFPIKNVKDLTDSVLSRNDDVFMDGKMPTWLDVEDLDTALSQQILQAFHDPQKMEVMSSTDRAKIWNECKVREVFEKMGRKGDEDSD